MQLAEEGHDIEEMQAHIHAIVVKTLLAVQARSPVAPTAWASPQCARGCLRRPIVRARLCVAECCFWVHRFLALCCTQRFEISGALRALTVHYDRRALSHSEAGRKPEASAPAAVCLFADRFVCLFAAGAAAPPGDVQRVRVGQTGDGREVELEGVSPARPGRPTQNAKLIRYHGCDEGYHRKQ